MNWVALALLAPFIYAVNVFLDKYLIESKFPDYRALPVFSAILALPVFVVLSIKGGIFLNLIDLLLVVLSGVFTIWAFSIYLEALIKEETSVIIIMLQLVPVMVLAMSYLVLGETLSLKQLLGFVLLFISSVFVSVKKNKGTFKFSRALILMVIADLLWALPYIFVKYASQGITFSSLIAYESLGVFIGGIFLLLFVPKIKRAFHKTITKIKKPLLGLVLVNECLFLGGKILTYMAVAIGPAALVSILGSSQIFFGILLGITTTLISPRIFKEDLSKSGLLKKGILGLVAFLGIILVS